MHAVLGLLIAFADAVAFIPLCVMMLMVNLFAGCESAKFSLGPPTVLAFIVYYLFLLLLFLALRMRRQVGIATCLYVFAFAGLLWRPSPPLLTAAHLHNRVILVNADHDAIELGTASTNDKMIDRFLAFNGAKVNKTAFECGELSAALILRLPKIGYSYSVKSQAKIKFP